MVYAQPRIRPGEVKKLATVVEGDPKAPFSIATTSRTLLLSLDCSTLPLIRTLYCWVLSKEVLCIILKVFGMTWPGIESRAPGPLANTQPTKPKSRSGERDPQTPLGFWDSNRLPYLGQTTRPSYNQQKKRTCRIVDFVWPLSKIERKGG